MSTFFGIGVNESATIAVEAASAISAVRCLAIKFDSNGKGVLAGAGENAIGIAIPDGDEGVAAGADINVQVKDIGRWVAGEAVKPGDELTSSSAGKAVKATAGDFITAIALTEATASGDIIAVQIVKAGYVPASE